MPASALSQAYNYEGTYPPVEDPDVKNADDVAVSGSGMVYVADSKNDVVHVYRSDAVKAEVIQSIEHSEGTYTLSKPRLVYVSHKDELYIVDENYIIHLDIYGNGNLFGQQGGDIGESEDILDIAVDCEGYVYVVNGSRNQIDIYTPRGEFLTWLAGTRKSFNEVRAIGVSAENYLYVLDVDRNEIVVRIYDENWNIARWHALSVNRPDINVVSPDAMCVLANGDFILLDGKTRQFTHLSYESELRGIFGAKGKSGKGTFERAEGIYAGTAGYNVVAALDGKTNQVQLFTLPKISSYELADLRRMEVEPEDVTVPVAAPRLLASSAEGTVFVVSANEPGLVQMFARDSGVSQALSYEFRSVVDMAVSDDQLFVLDGRDGKIVAFTHQGEFIREFGSEMGLKDPTSIGILSDGNVLVVDKSTGLIHMWTPQGVYQKLYLSASEDLISPYRMEVGSDDALFIWDDTRKGILKIPPGEQNPSPGMIMARDKQRGIAGEIVSFFLDPYDRIYIFNGVTYEFEVFDWDDDKEIFFSFGNEKTEPYAFGAVENIVFDRVTFEMVLSDSKDKFLRQYQYSVEPEPPVSEARFSVRGDTLLVIIDSIYSKEVIGYGVVTESNSKEGILYQSRSNVVPVTFVSGKTGPLRQYPVSISHTGLSKYGPGYTNYFGHASSLFAVEDYPASLEYYRMAIDSMPADSTMAEYVALKFGELGRRLSERGNYTDGIGYLVEANSIDPGSQLVKEYLVDAMRKKYVSVIRSGGYDNMLAEVREMIDDPALKPMLLSSLANVAADLAEDRTATSLEQSSDILRYILEQESDAAGYYGQLGMTLVELYKVKMETMTGSSLELDVLLNDAEIYLERGVQGLKQLGLDYYPENLALIYVLNTRGKYSKAEAVAVSEITNNLTSLDKERLTQYRLLLAQAYLRQGKSSLAVSEYQNIISQNPRMLDARLGLGEALIEANQLAKAKTTYQQLLLDDQDEPLYLKKIGEVELLMGNFSEASFQLEKALSLDPADQAIHGLLGDAFLGSSNFQKALDHYGIAIEHQQSIIEEWTGTTAGSRTLQHEKDLYARYLVNAAQINEQIGDFFQAIEFYELAIDQNQANAGAWYGLGTASLSAGRVYNAVKALNTAVNLDPSNDFYKNAQFNALSLREEVSKNQPPLTITELTVDNIYPSLYRNYADVSKLPVGKLVLTNNTSTPITPSQVTFSVAGISESATRQSSGALLGFSNNEIKLSLVLSEEILDRNDQAELRGIVEVKYASGGKTYTIDEQTTVTVLPRNAITWDDKRRMTAFIGSGNENIIEIVRNLQTKLAVEHSEQVLPEVTTALQVYTALRSHGLDYTPDPDLGYASTSVNTSQLDYLQFPEETIRRNGGDCDDLVTLFCAMLESVGVPTAYVDVPGHVFMAFQLSVHPDALATAGLQQEDVIVHLNNVWIPVETTVIANETFLTAVRAGAERYLTVLEQGILPEIVEIKAAQSVYTPVNYSPDEQVTLDLDWTVCRAEVQEQTDEMISRIRRIVIGDLEARYREETGNTYTANKYAIALARTGQTEEAMEVLEQALEFAPDNAAIINNFGNLLFKAGNYEEALDYYIEANLLDPEDEHVMMNLCRTYLELGDLTQGKVWYDKARAVNSDVARMYEGVVNLK